MDLTKKQKVYILGADGKDTEHTALLFGNNAAWHCVLCGELNGDRSVDGVSECKCGKKYEILTANDKKGEAAIGVRALLMTPEELGYQLQKMHARGHEVGAVDPSLVLFGMRYDAEMKRAKTRLARVVNSSGVGAASTTEINKGRRLADCVEIVRLL